MRSMALICFFLMVCTLAGCGDSGSGSDPMSGTGSAGGNPLVVGFDYEESDEDDDLSWEAPQINIGTILLAHRDKAGECVVDDALEINKVYTFSSLRELEILPPYPCSIEFRPPVDEILLSVQGEYKGYEFELRFPRDTAVKIELQGEERLEESQDIVLFWDTDALLRNVDLGALVESLANGGDELDQLLLENVAAAITVYLDPDPEDEKLHSAERTEENIIATFGVVPPEEGGE